jgi:hypothetical protein
VLKQPRRRIFAARAGPAVSLPNRSDFPLNHFLQICHPDLPFFADFESREFALLAPIPNRLLRYAEKPGKFLGAVNCFPAPRHIRLDEPS